jgi:hypothetical protein
MVALMPPQTVLTPNSAANNLQAQGLDALGLAGPSLSPMWAGSNAVAADYDPAALTLRLTNPRAAWRGIADWQAAPALFSDPTGMPLTGQALVLTLHPQAVQRLQAEIDLRTNSTVYSVPTAMVVRGLAPPATLPPSQIYLAGETLGTGTGLATFHDSRGLIIDPVALACLFNDLIGWRSALMGTTIPGMALGGPGGLTNMVGLATGDLCHVVDPHGWRFNAFIPATQLRIVDNTAAAVGNLPGSGLTPLAVQQAIGRSNADVTALAGAWSPLRWGFARNGTLAAVNVTMPALPNGVALARRFFRLMAVDLTLHIVGNRTPAILSDTVVGTVPADDGAIPAFLLPPVRDQVPGFAWLSNGVDVMGAIGASVQNFGANPADQPIAIAVSPAIDGAVRVPAAPGPTAHWPNAPAPDPASGNAPLAVDITQGASARWRNPGDGTRRSPGRGPHPARRHPPVGRLHPRLPADLRRDRLYWSAAFLRTGRRRRGHRSGQCRCKAPAGQSLQPECGRAAPAECEAVPRPRADHANGEKTAHLLGDRAPGRSQRRFHADTARLRRARR